MATTTPALPRSGAAARAPARRLGRRAVSNLLRMGHCAPTLVQTLLEAVGAARPELVTLASALPGMGNTGNECGCLSGPLVVLGLRHSGDPAIAGVPAPVARGRALVDAFRGDHGTTRCRDILGDARLPLRCIGAVHGAPDRCLALESGALPAMPPARQAAHAAFFAHLEERGFHCARSVLQASSDPAAKGRELHDAAAAFAGGTAMAGLTCGALAGGFLLLGRRLGAVEDSHLRVLRQVATLALRGDAFADERNAFNRAMNRGHELARWFAGRFGSTQCRELTGCDLDTAAGVRRYQDEGRLDRCADMAREVAKQVDAVVAREAEAGGALELPIA